MTELIKYDQARRALAEAATVDDAKNIRDKAEALEAYARQQKNVEMEKWVAEIKLRATVRIGEISRELEKGSGPGRGNKTIPNNGKSFKTKTLKAAGISTSAANRAEQLAKHEKQVEAYIQEKARKGEPVKITEAISVSLREDERKQKEKWKAPPLPENQYSLIYADPPWRYDYTKAESRAIENQYPTMTLEEICALPVPSAEDCVLFLWATSPKLPEAMRVIDAWGFNYRTCAVWDKGKIGMGYYFRQQHELLLVATRGKPGTPEESSRVSSIIKQPRGKHSEKPEQVYSLIENMYPKAKRIELFNRIERSGWDGWGNQSEAV